MAVDQDERGKWMMTDLERAKLPPDGRVVARFHTVPDEVRRAPNAFTPPAISIGTGWGKRGLLALGLAIGALWALGAPYWPAEWTRPVTTGAFAFAAGIVAALWINFRLWKRQQPYLEIRAREADTEDVTVTCLAHGIAWATPAISHTVQYDAIDEVMEHDGLVLIRYRLFVLHIPERGFAVAADKAFLMDTLFRRVAADKLIGLAAVQG